MLVLNSTNNSMMPPSPNSTGFPPRDLDLAMAEVITLAAIFICALFGNAIMVFVLCCKRKPPSRMHIFMMHLCIADLLVAIFQVFPQLIWDITDLFMASDFVCRLITYLQVVGMFSSTYMTVGMTIDRYQAVCFPLVTFQGRRARWNIVVGATWLLSLLLSIPQIFVFSLAEISPGVHTCYANFVGNWGRKAYVMWICIAVFVVPTIILVVCQTTICHVLWSNMYTKTHRNVAGNSNQIMLSRVNNVNSISRAMIKTVKMTIVIVIVYIICWTPFMVMQLWSIWDPHPPKIVKSNAWANDMKIREQRGVVGGTTTLPCHAPPEEQQHVDFEWTFINETNVIIDYTNDEIDNEGNERVKFIGDLTKGDASITIEDLRLDDSGVYTCEWTYYSLGPREKQTLVNLTITATASPQNCSSHIVAAVVVTLVMVISVAVAVAVYFCKRKNWFCWRENIKNNTAEENIPMNVPSSNNGQNDGEKDREDGGVQTSLASDLEHNHVDIT